MLITVTVEGKSISIWASLHSHWCILQSAARTVSITAFNYHNMAEQPSSADFCLIRREQMMWHTLPGQIREVTKPAWLKSGLISPNQKQMIFTGFCKGCHVELSALCCVDCPQNTTQVKGFKPTTWLLIINSSNILVEIVSVHKVLRGEHSI